MIKYSKVYRNQSTVVPRDIAIEKNTIKHDVIKWSINRKTNEITIETLLKDEINPDFLDNVIKTENHMNIYRNISQKRHVILPAEVEKILKFNRKVDLLKWTLEDDKINISKTPKVDLVNISGILSDENKVKR